MRSVRPGVQVKHVENEGLTQSSACAGEIPGANLQILGSNLVYLILHKGCDCIVLKQEPYWLF